MFNRIMKKLNGHAAEPTSLSEALAQLDRDRTDIEAEIARLGAERKTLLLEDAPDAQLDKVERQIDRANVRLEKVKVAEPPLREALATATATERKQRWEQHVAAHRAAAQKFLVAARATVEMHERLVAIKDAARREGFEHEIVGAMPATPNIHGNPLLVPHALDDFERSLAPAPRSPGGAPRGGIQWYSGQPGSARYDPTTPPGPPKPTLQHSVVMAPMGNRDLAMGSSPTSSPRMPNDEEPLGPGEVRATVLRHGYNAPDGSSCHVGRRIRLPRDLALVAARNGAIEIIDDPTRKAVDSASERTFQPVGSLSETHADSTVDMGRSS